MNEFGAALQFFDGFGENWYALEDCLRYLDEWLPADAYVLVVERAEELLQDEERNELISFLKVLSSTGEFWSKPVTDGDRFDRDAIPFHVLLNTSSTSSPAETRLAKVACDMGIAFRNE